MSLGAPTCSESLLGSKMSSPKTGFTAGRLIVGRNGFIAGKNGFMAGRNGVNSW